MEQNLFKSLLLALLAAMLPQVASAYDFKVDGLCYNYNSDGTSVTVTYEGTGANDNGYSNLSGELIIPESVTYNGTTYSVTTIGDGAFYNCTGLTQVTIPNSVTTIGYRVFYDCTGLTSVTIGNSVTTIGDFAFLRCRRLTSVTIPNSVTTIGSGVFSNCSGLTSVTIPNSVTTIGYNAFYNTAWFNNQPDGLVYAGMVAYKYKGTMPNGTSIVLKDGCTGIADYAFEDCTGLTSVIIPNSVTTIGDNAFSGCTGLTSVTIPNSVTTIGNGAFYNCTGLTQVTIPNSVTTIGDRVFYDCSGLTSVTIGNSVTTIGGGAFYRCTGLTSVIIPNSVTTIGSYAFEDCTGLTSVTIGNSVTTIGEYAFVGCSSLTEVTIPNSVTTTGNYAFSGCTGLTSVTIGNSVTTIGGGAFYRCTGLTSVIIPNSVTTIGEMTFYNCTGLTKVTIPNSVTTIGDHAFQGCTGLTEVTIPNSVTTIGGSAFDGCTRLEDMTILCSAYDNNIGASNVRYLYLGENVTSIKGLGISPYHVYCYGSTPPACDENTFKSYSGTLHVPADAVASYFSAPIWSNFTNIVGDAVAPTNVSIDKQELTIKLGQSYQFTAVMQPENVTGVTLQWRSTNPTVATITSYGELTAIATGETDVILTCNMNLTDTCHVTVVEEMITISLDKHDVTLNVNEMVTITPSHTPQAAIVEYTYSNTDESVLMTRMNGGKVQGLALVPGTSIITVGSADGKAVPDYCVVTVKGVDATSISLTPTELALTAGESSTLTATILPAAGTSKTLDWTSSDESVATVDATGKVTALKAGTATITATTTDGTNLSASCQVTVTYPITAGDANWDGTINVSDYVTTASYILEQNPQPFCFAAADIDGNDEINVIDLVGVAEIALNYSGAPQQAPAVGDEAASSPVMNAVASSESNGKHIVHINLSNSMSISAMQLDITLPQGIALVDAKLSDRATASHSVEFAQLSNGNYRILAASSACKAFSGNEGQVLTLTLDGEAAGSALLSGIKLATPQARGYGHDDITVGLGTTGVENIATGDEARIYCNGRNIVIDTPAAGVAKLVLPNGMSTSARVQAGHNILAAPATGIVIVKMGSKVVKLHIK